MEGSEAWIEAETPEQILEEGEVAFNYDEWDRELTDHRIGWTSHNLAAIMDGEIGLLIESLRVAEAEERLSE